MKSLHPTGRENLAGAVSMLGLAFFSVLLRFVVRFTTRTKFTIADWLILFSLVLFVVFAALLIHYIVDGPGPGTFELTDFVINAKIGGMMWSRAFMQTLYVADLFYISSITFIKISILAFFHSLFSISVIFQRFNLLAIALSIVWFFVFFFINAFLCRPVHMLWDAMGSVEYCFPSGSVWLGLEVTNCIIDFYILLLPLAMINTLKLNFVRKCQVGGIFLLGGLACVTSIIKIAYMWNPKSPEVVRLPMTMFWSSVQLGVATLCACMPTYAALFKTAREKITRNYPSRNPAVKPSHYYRMGEDSSNVKSQFTVGSASPSYQMDQMEPGAIYVNRSVDVNVK
ncbi:uncharacterized protein KD926_000839 [Aspergillus affinis]|uniref:uncharacterized protein n=1 Tax=Aspergillus affinis TaxID=1070780 RepID=UPI0022FEDA74|nr:uncharacterized protein KD926_000839 [Aspergillus affinis]KAI9037122.1 hypothetical protein KD926_000839 [Aspergillus affinis]